LKKNTLTLIVIVIVLVALVGIAIGTELKGIIVKPDSADTYEEESQIYKALGNYFAQKGEHEEAIIAYEKSLIYTEDQDVRNNLAILYHQTEDYTKAIEHLRILVDLETDNPSYHYDLAVNLVDRFRSSKEQSLQDLLDAIEEYEKAEELEPGYEYAKENIEVLKRILKIE